MISLSYVKGSMPTPLLFDANINLMLEFDRIIDEVNEAKYAYESAYADYLLNKEFLESSDNRLLLEAEENFISKIGAAIIAMFKKGAEFINKIVSKIKDITFKNKNELDKLSQLQKKHPGEASDIKIAVENGWLDLKSASSLKELEETYSSIMRLKSASDANLITRKWNDAKRKFKEAAPAIGQIGAVAGSIVTIATIAATINSANKSAMQASHNLSDKYVNIYKTLKDRGENANGEENLSDDNKFLKDDSLDRMKLKVTQEYIGLNTGSASLADKISFSIMKSVVNMKEALLKKFGNTPLVKDINSDRAKAKDEYIALMKTRLDEQEAKKEAKDKDKNKDKDDDDKDQTGKS